MAHSISRRQFLQGSGAAALSVAAAGLLSSCGGSSASNGGSTGAAGSSSTYTVLYSRQPATLNYLVCSADPDLYHGTQCIDTLVEYDNRGKIREGLATAWEWDADSLTWTFHLRDENWVDCNGEVLGPVTAQDFVDALAYVLNPDYASSTASLVTPYVAGAEDYYNYLFYKASAENGTVAEDGTTYAIDANGTVTAAAADGTTTEYPAVDFSTVGVKAVDDHTLTYTLNFDFPGFLSLLSYAPYEPAYGPLLEEFADQFCTSAETACSCGAFYLAEYTPLENWVMKKNPENYDADSVYIDTVRYIYNQEELISGPEMVKRGEIDQATISSDILDSWLADDTTKDMVSMERPETGKSYFYIFNFLPYRHEFSNWTVTGVDAQYEPDNWAKAINSTNFRRAFLYAINPSVTLAVTAPEGYDNYKLHTITPPSFCANSKGVDYTECGGLANLSDFFDEAKAKEYRDAAVEELTAAGVTFPIKIQYPYNPAVVDWDKQCQVFKQQLEGVLNDGTDFIDIIITAGGKNVSPGPIEDVIKRCEFVSQALVLGDKRPFISALITLDEEALRPWLESKGLNRDMSMEEASSNAAVRAEVQKWVDQANEGVSRAESVRKFIILPEEFTQENGLMTASMKVIRPKVIKRYATLLNTQMYTKKK